jgi:hypothetical protein
MTDEAFTEEVVKPETGGSGVTKEDFVAYIPAHTYIFTPCREMWTGSGVNARVPKVVLVGADGQPLRTPTGKVKKVTPTVWLDKNRPVEQMTWCPGQPMLIRDRLVVLGGWIERPNVTCFNHYKPPRLELGDASQAGPWLDHVRAIYPDGADHIVK